MMNQNLSNLTEHPQNTGLVKSPPNNTENLQKDTLGQGLSLQEFIAECQERTYTLTTEQLNELVTCLNSENLYRQYFGVIGIRKLLATPSPPIQPLIDAGIIPRLVEFLGKEDEHQLQAEAAWTFGNLCSGTTEQTQQIVENGAIPALIMLLRSPNHDVKLKAIWPLGNLAGDSVDSRDEILEGGAVSPLIEILEKAIFEGDKLMIRDANWVLANLCRGKPLPLFEEIKEAIPLFAKVIMSQEDPGILIEAVWCLFYFSDEGEKGEERVQQVIDTGVVPYMVKHMDHSHLPVLIGCLRTIGNILLGDDEQVDMLLKIPGVMEKLFSALNHKKEAVRKYAAMAISNFTSGTSDHLEYIVGNPEYLDQLLNVGINDIQEIRKEIAVVLNDIIDKANKEQMRILLEENKKKLFAFFRKLLVEKEVSLQKIALAGIWMIWDLKAERAPEGFTKASCWALWEKNKILTALKELQGSSSPSIKELVAKILGAGAVEKQ